MNDTDKKELKAALHKIEKYLQRILNPIFKARMGLIDTRDLAETVLNSALWARDDIAPHVSHHLTRAEMYYYGYLTERLGFKELTEDENLWMESMEVKRRAWVASNVHKELDELFR